MKSEQEADNCYSRTPWRITGGHLHLSAYLVIMYNLQRTVDRTVSLPLSVTLVTNCEKPNTDQMKVVPGPTGLFDIYNTPHRLGAKQRRGSKKKRIYNNKLLTGVTY